MHAPRSTTWEIRTNRGGHAGAGTEGTGWLWEISRGDQLAQARAMSNVISATSGAGGEHMADS